MSVDIYSGEAVFLAYSDFLDLFQPAHLDGLRDDAIRLFRNREGVTEHTALEELISRLQSSESIEDAVQILAEIGDDRFELECTGPGIQYSEGDEYLVGSFLSCLCKLVLPTELTNVCTFDTDKFGLRGPQYTECELDVFYLEFELETCFETTTTMTNAGRALASVLGESEITASKWAYIN